MNEAHVIFSHSFSSVVIHNLHIECITIKPKKTEPPLIVDANAVLTLSTTSQRLEMISGWRPQKAKRWGSVNHCQFPLCPSANPQPAALAIPGE
jgi:hypothetical protein